jgi:hypothetical protein
MAAATNIPAIRAALALSLNLSFLRLFLRFTAPERGFLAVFGGFLAVLFTQRQDTNYAAAWSMEILSKSPPFLIPFYIASK